MSRPLSNLVVLLAFTGAANARPQGEIPKQECPEKLEYAKGVETFGPFTLEPESAGGMSCIASSAEGGEQGCSHTKTYSHSVGVAYTISGGLNLGLDIKEIFHLGGDVGASKS